VHVKPTPHLNLIALTRSILIGSPSKSVGSRQTEGSSATLVCIRLWIQHEVIQGRQDLTASLDEFALIIHALPKVEGEPHQGKKPT